MKHNFFPSLGEKLCFSTETHQLFLLMDSMFGLGFKFSFILFSFNVACNFLDEMLYSQLTVDAV